MKFLVLSDAESIRVDDTYRVLVAYEKRTITLLDKANHVVLEIDLNQKVNFNALLENDRENEHRVIYYAYQNLISFLSGDHQERDLDALVDKAEDQAELIAKKAKLITQKAKSAI